MFHILQALKKKHLSYRTKLIIWVVVIKILIKVKFVLSAFLYSSKVGLFPDEAQYWTWSHALSYAYYSKPMAIAYQIAFGCAIFGDTELGVRFGSFLLSCALSLAIFYLAKKAALPEKMAFIAALAFTLTPLGFSSTFLATTDCGAMLFWTLACAVFVDDLMEQKKNRYLLYGLLIGLGALFKWTSFLVWIPILGFSIYYKKTRPLHFLAGLGISLLAFAPQLIWNMHHDYATFRHVARSLLFSADTAQAGANPLQFIGAQFGLISPILMVLVLIALCKMASIVKKLPPSILFCFVTTALSLAAVFGISCFKKVQGNWGIFAYPTAFVLLLACANMQGKRFLNWIYGGIAFSCVLILTLLTLLVLQKHHHDGFAIPYKMNPFRDALGWDNLTAGLKQVGYNPKEQFLISDRYQTASILSFYGPGKKRAYFFNIRQLRKNQFSFWQQMRDCELHKSGYFVGVVDGPECLDRAFTIEQKTQRLLKPYFDTIEPTSLFIPLLDMHGKVMKVAYILRCNGYNGGEPPEIPLY